jgi:hypothetical protein
MSEGLTTDSKCLDIDPFTGQFQSSLSFSEMFLGLIEEKIKRKKICVKCVV